MGLVETSATNIECFFVRWSTSSAPEAFIGTSVGAASEHFQLVILPSESGEALRASSSHCVMVAVALGLSTSSASARVEPSFLLATGRLTLIVARKSVFECFSISEPETVTVPVYARAFRPARGPRPR